MPEWTSQDFRKIEADFQRSANTHLIKVELPTIENIQLYLKDESTRPTGSFKLSLAPPQFLCGLCNDWIRKGNAVDKASFVSAVIDRMIRVPDAATYTAIHFLEKLLNRKPGCSTGTNVYAAFKIIADLKTKGHKGNVVSMLCD